MFHWFWCIDSECDFSFVGSGMSVICLVLGVIVVGFGAVLLVLSILHWRLMVSVQIHLFGKDLRARE